MVRKLFTSILKSFKTVFYLSIFFLIFSKTRAEDGILPSIDGKNPSLAKKIMSGDIHIEDLDDFILYMIEFMIVGAGIYAVFMIIVGGYQWIMIGFGGDASKARKTIKFAITGFVISITAWFVVYLVRSFLTS